MSQVLYVLSGQFNRIPLVDGAYAVDPEKCADCGDCVDVCPTSAIRKE